MRVFPLFKTDYDQGWGKSRIADPAPAKEFAPTRPVPAADAGDNVILAFLSNLRHAVQWRKITFGTRSGEGELAVARLLTLTRTCQLQRINVLAYLTAAIHCRRGGQVVASLMPKRRTP